MTDTNNTSSNGTVIINTVTEDVPIVAIKDKIFKLEIGKTEESYRFGYAEIDKSTSDNPHEANNIVRGKYSPYLAIYSDNSLDTSALYNIYQD